MIIHVKETMWDCHFKSHLVLSLKNRTDAICLFECDEKTGEIQKMFNQVIE